MKTLRNIGLVIVATVLLFPLFQDSTLAAEKKVKFVVDGIS